ncbi:MAG: AarF/ABC1/UbiB kinase family protein [Syntrophomonadaceae bacterium]|nr:AarF/ABC1/UbiB kinase family protein [Syntrophomonadaceae bacterium]
MYKSSWAGLKRFIKVVSLFISIFWSFYSIKYKKLWHTHSWAELRRQELYAAEARRFRQTAIELGGLLIKLGQFFSTRVDILPQSAIAELSGLQDEVEPVSFKDIRLVAEEDFSHPLSEIYAEVNEMPLASASLGQVHRGVLVGGETVAIKILRPGIEDLVRIDLKAVRKVIDILKIMTDWEQYIDIDAIFNEFADTLLAELNYLQEGKNAETIAANSQDPDLLIPAIFWEYTTHRVLTMEFMDGIKISDYPTITGAGVDRQAIAQKLLQTYVKQVLVDGFFHADPHPGNLFVTENGRIIMIDFGMVGTISPALRDVLVDLVFALVKRDNLQVVSYLKRIGFLRYDADNELVARAVGVFLEEALGAGVDLYSADFSGLLNDLEQLLYEQPFQIPAKFTFLGRALGTLYGLCIGLDPNINFLDESKPYLEGLAKGEKSIWNTVKDKAALWGSSLVEIPPLAEKVLSRMERGELSLKLPLSSLDDSINTNTRAKKGTSWAIIFGFTILTSAYLQVNHYATEAAYAFYFSILAFLLMLRQNRTIKHRRLKAPHPHMLRRRDKNS